MDCESGTITHKSKQILLNSLLKWQEGEDDKGRPKAKRLANTCDMCARSSQAFGYQMPCHGDVTLI